IVSFATYGLIATIVRGSCSRQALSEPPAYKMIGQSRERRWGREIAENGADQPRAPIAPHLVRIPGDPERSSRIALRRTIFATSRTPPNTTNNRQTSISHV